jgi:polyhydroxybutyrate depolymerase
MFKEVRSGLVKSGLQTELENFLPMTAGRLGFLSRIIGLIPIFSLAGAMAALGESPPQEPVRTPMTPKVRPRIDVNPQVKPKTGEILRMIVHRGQKRTYYVYIPPLTGNRPLPTIVGLHGRASTPRNFSLTTNFNRLADRQSFIMVYPEAVGNRWQHNNEDLSFITAILTDIERARPIDRRRVYAVGMAEGGMMAQYLACATPDQFKAIASVAATLTNRDRLLCRQSQPVSMLLVAGTADRIVPWRGGKQLSVPKTIDLWRNKAGCQSQTSGRTILDGNRRDRTQVKIASYQGCQPGLNIALMTVIGGGHTWPGGLGQSPNLGATTTKINATESIWNFFDRKPL